MHSAWLRNHPDSEKRKKQVKTYKPVLDDLKQVLEKEFEKKPAVRDYEAPNWELRQIAVNEWNASLAAVIKLLEVD